MEVVTEEVPQLDTQLPLHIFRPQEYLRSHLQNDIRFDTRKRNQIREYVVRKNVIQSSGANHVVSSSQVQHEGTNVICAVTLLVGIPTYEHPTWGDVSCNITFDHLLLNVPIGTRSEGASKKKTDPSVRIANYLNDLFNKGNILNLEELCIAESKYAFRLQVNLTILSHAGNIQDTCILASLAALEGLKLPQTSISDNQVTLEDVDPLSKPLSLKIVYPFTIGFVFTPNSNDILYIFDPSDAEEANLQGFLTVVMDASGTIHFLSTMNDFGISITLMDEILNICEAKIKHQLQG